MALSDEAQAQRVIVVSVFGGIDGTLHQTSTAAFGNAFWLGRNILLDKVEGMPGTPLKVAIPV